ncbi:hypothetical protein [Clostridium arbusti]|uniref:hypothetical protein n=1 Tax=Clostridium arbusti TaxID=1137848 RepID=UPI0002886F74|nr:hypothetical protein [Clostridium arbusti]
MLNTSRYDNSKSIFSQGIFKFKLGLAIKQCEKLKDYAKINSDLNRDDYRYNLFITSENGRNIEKKYFLFKGSHIDGRLKELKKFKFESNNAKLVEDKIKLKVLAADIFSKNIFIYNFSQDEEYIYGNEIKKIKDKKYPNIVFMVSRDKVKLHKKNINSTLVFNDIESLINKYGY